MRRIPFTKGWQARPHANFFAEMHGAAAPWQDVTLPHDAPSAPCSSARTAR